MPRTGFLTILLLLAFASSASGAGRDVSVPDPAGGTPWTVRVQQESGDRTCASVRRGGAPKQRWCERLNTSRVYQYNVRFEVASDPKLSRTVVVVTLADSVVRARLQTPDGTVTYRRREGAPRVLVAVLAGVVDRPPLRTEVKTGKRTKIVRTAPSAGLEVADPAGGPAWRSALEVQAGGRSCVRWERVPPRYETPVATRLSGPLHCAGAGAAVPIAKVQVVDGRVVVVGLASQQVRGLTLSGSGIEPRALPVEARTRAFIAVLPSTVDPAGLTLGVRVAGGRETTRALESVAG